MKPFDDEPADGTPEHLYQISQKSIRSIIERCNGVLKMRFRCLFKQRVLHYDPETASKIINACVVLHNLCIEHNLPEVHLGDDEGDDALIDMEIDLGR